MKRPAPLRENDPALGVLQILAYFYLQNNLPGKSATLLAALEQVGQLDRRSFAMLALAHLRSGDPEGAIATLERMAASGHPDRTYHLILAQALVALDRHEDARQSMQRYLALRTPAPTARGQARTTCQPYPCKP
jgi:Flp pilus assembly protein TadD